MNILFLSINTPQSDRRDNITYNFIVKEMNQLSRLGHNVYFFSEYLKKITAIDNVTYLSKDVSLETNRIIRRAKNCFFLIKHFWVLWRFCLLDIKKTIGICGTERSLNNIIQKYNIDLIHTHFFYPAGENAIISAQKHKLPIIATLRGAELYNRPDLEYGAMQDQYYFRMAQYSSCYVDYFTAPNKYLVERLIDLFDISSEKVEHLPNGVNIKVSIPQQKRENGEVKFIAVGRLIKRKNYELLLSVMNYVGVCDVKLTIVGNGPLYDHLLHSVKEKGLNNVSITNEISKDELFGLMANSDCLVHPSFIEGMPNVVLESLALGIPCLVSDIPAHQGLIREGYNGYFFNPHKIDSLASKIRFIMGNRELLSKLRNNCIESVTDYSIESKINRYIRIYTRLIQGREAS